MSERLKQTQARAGIIIFNKNNELLLMCRIKPHTTYYGIPGGRLDAQETPEQAAVRELKEETTLDVTLGDLFLFVINENREEYYYQAQAWSGSVQLSGEEAERNCPDNQYLLEWVGYDKLKTITLYPKILHEKLITLYENKL